MCSISLYDLSINSEPGPPATLGVVVGMTALLAHDSFREKALSRLLKDFSRGQLSTVILRCVEFGSELRDL